MAAIIIFVNDCAKLWLQVTAIPYPEIKFIWAMVEAATESNIVERTSKRMIKLENMMVLIRLSFSEKTIFDKNNVQEITAANSNKNDNPKKILVLTATGIQYWVITFSYFNNSAITPIGPTVARELMLFDVIDKANLFPPVNK